jgi:predicted transcriptional regulator
MKSKEREEARRLRHEGYSVKEICQTLGVAKSSVSVWVRDIELTSEQRNRLIEKGSPRMRGRFDGAEANARKHLELRREYQEAGRLKAREQDPLHIAGCMLYWAEGRKARNRLELVNSDADLLKFYMKFLRESLDAPNDKMKIHQQAVSKKAGNYFTEFANYQCKAPNLSNMSLAQFRNIPVLINRNGCCKV